MYATEPRERISYDKFRSARGLLIQVVIPPRLRVLAIYVLHFIADSLFGRPTGRTDSKGPQRVGSNLLLNPCGPLLSIQRLGLLSSSPSRSSRVGGEPPSLCETSRGPGSCGKNRPSHHSSKCKRVCTACAGPRLFA